MPLNQSYSSWIERHREGAHKHFTLQCRLESPTNNMVRHRTLQGPALPPLEADGKFYGQHWRGSLQMYQTTGKGGGEAREHLRSFPFEQKGSTSGSKLRRSPQQLSEQRKAGTPSAGGQVAPLTTHSSPAAARLSTAATRDQVESGTPPPCRRLSTRRLGKADGQEGEKKGCWLRAQEHVALRVCGGRECVCVC